MIKDWIGGGVEGRLLAARESGPDSCCLNLNQVRVSGALLVLLLQSRPRLLLCASPRSPGFPWHISPRLQHNSQSVITFNFRSQGIKASEASLPPSSLIELLRAFWFKFGGGKYTYPPPPVTVSDVLINAYSRMDFSPSHPRACRDSGEGKCQCDDAAFGVQQIPGFGWRFSRWLVDPQFLQSAKRR